VTGAGWRPGRHAEDLGQPELAEQAIRGFLTVFARDFAQYEPRTLAVVTAAEARLRFQKLPRLG